MGGAIGLAAAQAADEARRGPCAIIAPPNRAGPPAPAEEGHGIFHLERLGPGRTVGDGWPSANGAAAPADLRRLLFPADPAANEAREGAPRDDRQAGCGGRDRD